MAVISFSHDLTTTQACSAQSPCNNRDCECTIVCYPSYIFVRPDLCDVDTFAQIGALGACVTTCTALSDGFADRLRQPT